MSVFLALDAARAAGIEVRLDGKELVLSAAGEPAAEVIDMLRQHKLSIVALLQRPLLPRAPLQPTSPWDATDWAALFEEQVDIRMGDGQPRPAAEARSFDCCVAEWRYRNAVITAPGPCPICGETDRPNDPLLAIGIIGGRAWLHIGCVKAWCTARKAAERLACWPATNGRSWLQVTRTSCT